MSQVFTSYSRRDVETVDHIVSEMKKSGLQVWIDREAIKAGREWRVQIVQAIDTCDAFVLMLSANSAASDNVRREIDLAQDSQRALFALMLEPVKLPADVRYQLAGLQFIDVNLLGMEKAARQLIETLREHLKTVQPAPSTRQAELVIEGLDVSALDAKKQEQLIQFIAQLTHADASALKIEKITAGSVHVFVNMPAQAAFLLKTMALNRDKRFGKLGITALRLAGDSKYVRISLGLLTVSATTGFFHSLWLGTPPILSSLFGVQAGKIITLGIAAALTAGIAIGAAKQITPPAAPAPAPATETASPPPPTRPPTGTFTAPPPTATARPTLTETAVPSPEPVYHNLTGIVTADQLACRHGPGPFYLYKYGLIAGNQIEFSGRMEIQSDSSPATWLYGLPQYYDEPCWVNARFVNLDGESNALEPDYYPDKAPLHEFSHVNFPPPSSVDARRSGEWVAITWTGYPLAPGDMEAPDRPISIAETWTCQAGRIVFTVFPAYDAYGSARVRDEPGCSAPSHGRVFIMHKDGYIGPVEVSPWPAAR